MEKRNAGEKERGAGRGTQLPRPPRIPHRAAIDRLPKPVRRDNAAAGDLTNSPICPMRIRSRALPASLFSPTCTSHPTDFLRNGKWASLFRLVSQGIVAFLFALRKDPISLAHRP